MYLFCREVDTISLRWQFVVGRLQIMVLRRHSTSAIESFAETLANALLLKRISFANVIDAMHHVLLHQTGSAGGERVRLLEQVYGNSQCECTSVE